MNTNISLEELLAAEVDGAKKTKVTIEWYKIITWLHGRNQQYVSFADAVEKCIEIWGVEPHEASVRDNLNKMVRAKASVEDGDTILRFAKAKMELPMKKNPNKKRKQAVYFVKTEKKPKKPKNDK